MSLDELLVYDAEGIIPLPHESERGFRKRARRQLVEKDAGYALRSAYEEQKTFFCWPISRSSSQSTVKFWTWPLAVYLPLALVSEYFTAGTAATGMFLGYTLCTTGIRGYKYCKALYQYKQQQKQEEEISRKKDDILAALKERFPQHATYISERLTHDEWVQLAQGQQNQNIQQKIEELPGLKGKLIREKLRRDGILCKEKKFPNIWQTPLRWGKRALEHILITFCGAALLFEGAFAYRDVYYDNKAFTALVQEQHIPLQRRMEKMCNLNLPVPHVATGYRALHHATWREGQRMMEETFPFVSFPLLRYALMPYIYIGMGICAWEGLQGHYSSALQQITVVRGTQEKTLSLEDKYVFLHELGHYYIDSLNPQLLSHKNKSNQQAIENMIFHEGAAAYISIRLISEWAGTSGLVSEYRCLSLGAVAQHMADQDWHIPKSMQYPLGFVFIDYVLTEIGEEHLPFIAKHPPTLEEIFYPDRYVLGTKIKLSQKPVINYPEKNPLWTIRKYTMQQ